MAPHPTNIPKNLTYKKAKIPTKQHYIKIKKLMKLKEDEMGVIYVKGKRESSRDTTSVGLEFRQESYFFYLTGVDEPDFQVLIDLKKDTIYLVFPEITTNEAIWKGPSTKRSELLECYDVDEVINESELNQLVSQLKPKTVYGLDRTTSLECLKEARIDHEKLSPAMDEARLIKFQWEIDLIRQAAYASSQAHVALIQQFQPGMTELHLAALFRWTCALYGVYQQAYLPIVASGPRNSVLHYIPKSSQTIPSDPHSLVLVDAGGEKMCYGSDITRTFPVHGKFSVEAKTIYSIVLKMQKTVLSHLKSGVYWEDMEQLAIRTLCTELIHIGILVGDIDILIEQGVPCAFYYHGLGHTLGLDVHDVGGKKKLKDDPTSVQFLLDRTLEKNMVITVEPGLYFNDSLLAIWTQYQGYQQFFNMKILDQYRPVNGVRIEDTVVITDDGYENLTRVPKEIEEIEELMTKKN